MEINVLSVLLSIIMFSNIFMGIELSDRFLAAKFENKLIKYILRFNISFLIIMFFEIYRKMFI